jgi:L-fuculose-phosphate aldolase
MTPLQAALRYAAIGWRVLPLAPRRKTPHGLHAPKGCHDATADERRIRAWWQVCDDFNVGIATGRGLVVVDLDGNLVSGDVPPPAEVAMHTGVYRARKDVRSVCHGHPRTSTSFTTTDRPLVPVRHFAFRYPGGVPVHPDVTHIYSREQGDEVAATLGDGEICLLRGHGTVVVGDCVQQVYMRSIDLEENARTLLESNAAGGTLKPLTIAECDEIADSYSKTTHRQNKIWRHALEVAGAAGVL